MTSTVIFACVHNAGRSQMAAAFLNAMADPAKVRAISAGTQPAARVHPEVLEAMRAVGIDLSAAVPRKLTPELAAGAQLLITMGCGDNCPAVPGLRRDDWPLADPKGQSTDRVTAIRDEIRVRVARLIAAEGWGKPAGGYEIVDFSAIPAVACPCGQARRAFAQTPDFPGTLHRTEISVDAKRHYHKTLTETYYFLECGPDARMELDGEAVPVKPGMAVLIRPGVRHRALGKMSVLILALPKFDPHDEWFD